MHQTRKGSTTKLPVPRKGTKYLVRASSHVRNSVPVLIAIRDMLKLARNSNEVKGLIHTKSLKINGKMVKDYHESIKLFNILEADKPYVLSILPSGIFSLLTILEPSCRLNWKRLLFNLFLFEILQRRESLTFDSTNANFPEGNIEST